MAWRTAYLFVKATPIVLHTLPPYNNGLFDIHVERLHPANDDAKNAIKATGGSSWRVLSVTKKPAITTLMTPEAHFYGLMAYGVLVSRYTLRLTTATGQPLPEQSTTLYPVDKVWVRVTAATFALCAAAAPPLTVWLEPDPDRVGPATAPENYVYALLPLSGRPGTTDEEEEGNRRRMQVRVLECHHRQRLPSGRIVPYALFGAVLAPMIIQPPTVLDVGRHTAPGIQPTNLAVRLTRGHRLHVRTSTMCVRPGCDFAVAGRELRIESLTPSGFYARELEPVPPTIGNLAMSC
jgi:hypothetical protein